VISGQDVHDVHVRTGRMGITHDLASSLDRFLASGVRRSNYHAETAG
jgi:hypothetical protein